MYSAIQSQTLSSKNKYSKIPAYLKVVDNFPADSTFCRIGGLSNGLPSPTAGFQQPLPKTSVSLESFNAILQVKMGQQDLVCL